MTAQTVLTRPHQAKLSVTDFRVLTDAGAFASYAKAELLNGTIFVMNAAYSQHGRLQFELAFRLRQALEAAQLDLTIYTATSVELTANSMPEPDIVLAQSHSDGPVPGAKVRLVIEIADSTVKTDLGRKALIYSRAGVPEYWVADLNSGTLHQQTAPGPKGYGERREYPLGTTVEAASLGGLQVSTPTV